MLNDWLVIDFLKKLLPSQIFKPLPLVGAGGRYMFSGRLSVRPSVRDSRGSFMFPRYLVVSVDRFLPNFCHWCILGHRWSDYVFGSKGQISRSHHRGGGAQHLTLPSSATFSSFYTYSRLGWVLRKQSSRICWSSIFYWLDALPVTNRQHQSAMEIKALVRKLAGSFRVKSTKIYEVGNPTISEFSKKITTCTGTCL